MINGFEIEEYIPRPHNLTVIWKNGRQTIWPAATYAEALAYQDHIHLRTDLMQRLEVDGRPLWDADWEQDLLKMPPELHASLFTGRSSG